MKVKIKRFDQDLPLPKYGSERAAAFDLFARETTTIEPKQVGYIPLNVALELPKNHWVLMAARSSLHKLGLMMANGIGVGDEDFCGDNDEYQAAVYNYTDAPVEVERGQRIVQMIILPREKIELAEVASLKNQDRGGFGSTGKK